MKFHYATALSFVLSLSNAVDLPSTEIPHFTGEYNVGVSSHVIPFYQDNDVSWPSGVSSEFLATIFYPTLDEAAEQQPYLDPELAELYNNGWNFTDGVLKPLTASINWNASYLPESEGPTLIFGPGGIGPPTSAYTILLSELASKGYVIVSLDHYYEQPFLRLPDGTGVHGLPLDYAPTLEWLERMYELRLNDILHFVEIWPDLVNELDAPFETSHMGAFGHSFGGSLAFSAARQSDAIAAAINQDGSVWGDLTVNNTSADVDKPLMFLSAEGHNLTTDPSWMLFAPWQTGRWRLFDVQGTRHVDYSDATYWKEFGTTRDIGVIDGERMVDITNVFVEAFFEEHLLGKKQPILDNPGEEWPEVKLSVGGPGK